jgi:hypothetical protein
MQKNVGGIAIVSEMRSQTLPWVVNGGVCHYRDTCQVSPSIKSTWIDDNSIVAMLTNFAAALWWSLTRHHWLSGGASALPPLFPVFLKQQLCNSVPLDEEMLNSRLESLEVSVVRGVGGEAGSCLYSVMAPASLHLSFQPSGHDEKEDAGIILSTCQIWGWMKYPQGISKKPENSYLLSTRENLNLCLQIW